MHKRVQKVLECRGTCKMAKDEKRDSQIEEVAKCLTAHRPWPYRASHRSPTPNLFASCISKMIEKQRDRSCQFPWHVDSRSEP